MRHLPNQVAGLLPRKREKLAKMTTSAPNSIKCKSKNRRRCISNLLPLGANQVFSNLLPLGANQVFSNLRILTDNINPSKCNRKNFSNLRLRLTLLD